MIRGFLFLLILSFFSFNAHSQNRNNVWTFGDATGLNFNTDPVSPFVSKSRGAGLDPPYYLSSICSKNGDLLFYTDGLMVWNGENTLLSRYSKWWPWNRNVITLITPYVSNDSLYYIFGIDAEDIDGPNPFMLQYLTTRRYSSGDTQEVVYPRPSNKEEFYTTLLSNTSHVIAGTAHCNQVDTWITTHSPGALYSFLITAKGVDSVPSVTAVPVSVIAEKKLDTKYGNIKFSANGERLIIPENDVNKIVVYDFDNQNGKFANPKVLSVPVDQTLEDIEISADASKLYFGSYETLDPDVAAERHYIYQMDLNAGSSAGIEKTIYQVNAGDRVACFRTCAILRRTMQLGPDGRIYVTRRQVVGMPFDQTLGVINEPNKPGVDVNYSGTQVDLKTVPNFLNYSYIRSGDFTFRQNSIEYKKIGCIDDPVKFGLIFHRLDSAKWDFGDPSSGNNNFSNLLNPAHLYPVPGSYTVKAIIYDKCFADTTSVTITINDSKSVHVPGSIGDTVLCYGEQLFVNAADPLAKEYKWNDGVNVSGRVIDKEGDYTVTISNNCSLDRKTFNVSFKVCPCNFYIPNAFSPNGDGLNDVFKPILDCIPVEYQMKIYDRYGSVVYQTGKSTEGWNGTKKLHDLPAGVYMWIINYHHPGTNDFIKKKGTVTLLR